MKKKINSNFSTLISLSILFPILLFIKRAPFPDSSFDSINYHIFAGISYINNFPYLFDSNEFFPLGIRQFIPIFDVIWIGCMNLFGYRIGTIPSLIFFLLTISIMTIFIMKRIQTDISWPYKFLILFSLINLFIEGDSLFQLATYFTDNAYTFFLITLLIFLNSNSLKNKNILLNTFIFSILFAIIASKLVFFIYLIPLTILYFFYFIKKDVISISTLFKCMLVFSVIFLLFNYHYLLIFIETKNPFFPYYNGLFKSDFFPHLNWTFDQGPKSIYDRFLYPFIVLKDDHLLGETADQKIIILFFGLIFSYLYLKYYAIKIPDYIHHNFYAYLTSFILWVAMFGYNRYGIFLELWSGILFILLIPYISKSPLTKFLFVTLLIIQLWILILSIKILGTNLKYDMSWKPNLTITQFRDYLNESFNFESKIIVSKELEDEINSVDFIMDCGEPSSAYYALTNALQNKPLLLFQNFVHRDLTSNQEFIKKRNQNLFKDYSDSKSNFKFLSIVNVRGGPNALESKKRCFDVFNKDKNITIIKEYSVENFLGDKSFTLNYIFGTYDFNRY
jgi:hypothetical protein